MDVVQILSPPRGEPLTWRDLEDRPDDGRRYELNDGVLIVTPAPAWFHQRAVAGLYRTLYAACPAHLEVLFAPLDVRLAEDTVLQPDLLVVRIAEMTQRGLIGHEPVLAVEVLSPGTRSIDLHHKLERFERAGCPSYWVVDPDAPSLTVWQLREGRYVEAANVTDEARFDTAMPYDLRVVPAQLVR